MKAHEFVPNVRELNIISADKPLVAGDEGNELGGDSAADVGQQCDKRNREPNRHGRGGSVAADDQH